ncbi:hypothetical protein ElyMa_006738300 [Elysia marginata]|uniref:Uncharacterized protein n=1 Tax=Elysia marginata TaxID=1093978 RepID=A0AAV4IYQ2_9GAST|nr:hypothetical protein ElyMa_006738300 [Elysia marginata]
MFSGVVHLSHSIFHNFIRPVAIFVYVFFSVCVAADVDAEVSIGDDNDDDGGDYYYDDFATHVDDDELLMMWMQEKHMILQATDDWSRSELMIRAQDTARDPVSIEDHII